MSALIEKLQGRASGICLYGITPPKLDTVSDRLSEILARQLKRFAQLPMDGLVVYDVVDEPSKPYPMVFWRMRRPPRG